MDLLVSNYTEMNKGCNSIRAVNKINLKKVQYLSALIGHCGAVDDCIQQRTEMCLFEGKFLLVCTHFSRCGVSFSWPARPTASAPTPSPRELWQGVTKRQDESIIILIIVVIIIVVVSALVQCFVSTHLCGLASH